MRFLPTIFRKTTFIFLTVAQITTIFLAPVFSQSVTDLEDQVDQKNEEVKEKESTLDQVKKEIAAIQASGATLDEKISLMDEELEDIDEYIGIAAAQLEKKEVELILKEEVLEEKQTELGSASTVLYKRSRSGFIEYLLSNESGEDLIRSIIFKRFLVSRYTDEMRALAQEYAEIKQERIDLNNEKEGLQEERDGLEEVRDDLVAERATVQAEIARRNGLVAQLGGQISLLKEEISELQAAILLAKSGSAITGVGEVPESTDPGGNWANAPSGYFGVFSFGAYTHRNGMSQYGALGRANKGQSAEQILQAYYPAENLNKGYSVPSTIYVNGTNEYGQTFTCQPYSFDEYLKRLYEVPSSWPSAVLRSQATAARSYAIRYINTTGNRCNGQPYICPSQSCQVMKKEINASAWQQAVDATSSWVLTGGPGNFQYSSTSGGYLNTSGWDTTNGQGDSGSWTTNAYESIAGSPWFYKAWYRLGYSNSGSSCGRLPWMSQEEMADIINVWLVLKGIDLKGSVDYSRLVPITINSCPFGTGGGNPYSMAEVRALLNSPVTSISGSPVVANNSSGSTTTVSFSTNRGAVNISGSDFKEVFNSRAPGYIAIPQFGFTFINVQRK